MSTLIRTSVQDALTKTNLYAKTFDKWVPLPSWKTFFINIVQPLLVAGVVVGDINNQQIGFFTYARQRKDEG